MARSLVRSHHHRLLVLALALALAVAGAVSWPRTGAQATPTSLTISTDVDTYVSSARPTATHGSATWLSSCPRVCGTEPNADRRILLRFDVTGIPSDARNLRASLELHAIRAATGTMAARPVSGAWSEANVTYASMPAAGNSVAHRTSVVSGRYNAWDVTRAVTGNGAVSLMIYSETGQHGVFASSDDPQARGPRLKLTFDTTGTKAPSASATPRPSATTASATATPRAAGDPTGRGATRCAAVRPAGEGGAAGFAAEGVRALLHAVSDLAGQQAGRLRLLRAQLPARQR